MNEQDLRALVREAVDRHLGKGNRMPFAVETVERAPMPYAEHPSHILLKVVPGSEMEDGMCVIEPSVRCNHCGFCQSYGH